MLLEERLGHETTSWLCILCAVPVAAVGFFRYNEMTAEQFVRAWLKSEFLCAGPRVFRSENHYYNILMESRKAAQAGQATGKAMRLFHKARRNAIIE